MEQSHLNLPASKLPAVQHDERSTTEERIDRIGEEFRSGWNFLSGLKKTVTLFGSARFEPSDAWYKEAERLAALLAGDGFTVVTGGGPGIMEAGNRGASGAGADSAGLNIQLAHEQRMNPYVKLAIGFHYFFVRKLMLSYSAQAYVYFPGGFGTLDEFFEIITLIQTKKIPAHIPVILVGRGYWEPLLRWIDAELLAHHRAIDEADTKIYRLVDTAEEAFEIIKACPERTIRY